MAKMVKRSWVWHFPEPPAAVWAAFADTPRLNEAVGAPKHQIEELQRPNGAVTRLAHAMLRRTTLEWEERPYQWVEGRWFRQERLFHKGPLRRLEVSLELAAEDGGGVRAHYSLGAEPAGWGGRLSLGFGFLDRIGRDVEAGVRILAAAAAAGTPASADLPGVAPHPHPTRTLRVDGMVEAIEAGGNGHGLARRLADFVLSAPDSDVERIRPLALARAWQEPPRHGVELCLGAVKAGLLSMSWDILCPRCRGAKSAVSSLDRLPKGVHCASCNVPYDADFSRNVELTVRPAATVRPVEPGGFCLSGPGVAPHIAVQQILAPGERRLVETGPLPRKAWRLRTMEPGAWADVEGPDDGAGLPFAIAETGLVMAGAPAPAGHVGFENRTDHELTFVLEDRSWIADALTAHQVTTLEAFRELFSDEVLRPGDEVAVDRVTLLFSDLKASTALYGRVGDARAYHLVREHFAYLTEKVRVHDGAVVKTIGDAVMAAFSDPERAVAAAVAIQRDLTLFNARAGAGQALVIKLGLHVGPCVAVTLNGRFDYFGGTVNLAARLQDQSRGGDVVLSEALAADPGVSALLSHLTPIRERSEVKGLSAPVAFLRIPADSLATAVLA